VDVTGDGVRELLMGSTVNNEGEHHAGKAVVFSYDRSVGSCEILLHLRDPEQVVYDNLGAALTGTDDIDGDGIPDIAVGEPGDDTRADSAGAVLVFSGLNGQLLRRLTDPAGAGNHRLGRSVADVGDVDGDGIGDLAAGTQYGERVVLFSGADGSVLRTLTDPGGAAGERLGWHIAAVVDLDGDGARDVIAGAPWADVGGVVDAGRAVVLSSAGGPRLAELRNESDAASNHFGWFVAAIGDLSGDGADELMVGVPYENLDTGADAGTFSVFALEAECDGDGVTPFAGDCDDGNDDLWGLPSEARDLWLHDDKQTVEWSPPAEPGTGSTVLYDVLASTYPDEFGTAICLETGMTGTSATDDETLAPDTLRCYLVRAVNGCGPGALGTWGEEGWPREGWCPP
jgi:hypothetical protein